MRLPPWAIEALAKGVADVARKASDAETVAKVREQASELFRDLPENASRGLDAILKTATDAARDAVDQSREVVARFTDSPAAIGARVINASGTLLHPSGSGVPVADSVLASGTVLLRGDCVQRGVRAELDRLLARALDRSGYSLAVASNFDAAVASLRPLGSEQPLVIHRSQAIRLPSGRPLPDALGDANIQQCGGVQSLESDDFASIDRGVVVFADDGTRKVEPIDFAERDISTIAIVPIASIKDRFDSLPSAEVLLRNGIDLVVLGGGSATGGVDAGILVGRTDLIDSIRGGGDWPALAASDSVAAMTLAALEDTEATPLEALIETSTDNLRSRAERLTTRLAAEDAIATAQITDQPARLTEGSRWQFESRQLRLRHQSLSAEAWSKQLADSDEEVLITAVDGEDLIVDLRWFPPSADSRVGELLSAS